MKAILTLAVGLILFSTTVIGAWALIPMEKVVAKSDLIVVGTLHSAEEDSEGIGQGYIKVDDIVFGNAVTLENTALKIGDNLKLKWADNWACARGMHKGRIGMKGIWLLTVNADGTVEAGYPGRFIDQLEKLTEIQELKKGRSQKVSVDVQDHDLTTIQPGAVEMGNESIVTVDVTPFPDRPARRVLFVSMVFIALYWLLYRSKYRIR